jgi:cytochrome c oxidase subunit 4
MAGHSEAEIHKYVKTCIAVFATLMVLTIVTVVVSYVHLDTPSAIAVGLIVATVKASLVALFFMHLISERNAVYYLLCLTGLFFLLLMYLPSGWYHDEMKTKTVWSVLPQPAEAGAHGGEAPGHEAGSAAQAHH